MGSLALIDNKLQGLKGDATPGREIISGGVKQKTLVKRDSFQNKWLDEPPVLF